MAGKAVKVPSDIDIAQACKLTPIREIADKLPDITGQVLRTGHWSGELAVRVKDDRRLLVRSSCTLVRDKDGQPKSILSVNTEAERFPGQYSHD